MIFWFTGNSGAGKTSIINNILKNYNIKNVIVLDGNKIRSAISKNLGFSKKDRMENNKRIARLAKLLESQNYTILIGVIAPFPEIRDEVTKICSPKWIYIHKTLINDSSRPYISPENPDLIINNDKLDEKEAAEKAYKYIKGVLNERKR